MAEPATDVACESVFTMLYIIMLESKDEDRWDECCQIIDPETLSPQALQLLPPEHVGKVLVRMEDPLLERWFSACKVISETVVQVYGELDTETPCRKDVFPRLLWHLGFGERESEELCWSVDDFYTKLFNLRLGGKYTCSLTPCLRCPSASALHQKILHMFNGLQTLHCVYESQQSMDTAQSSRASSSIAIDIADKPEANISADKPEANCSADKPESIRNVSSMEEDAADEALAYILNWLDPERLSEDVLIKPLLEREWTNVKEPSLCCWRRCFGALADVGKPELKQKAAVSMAMDLARFVSDLGLESEELRDLSSWVLAEQSAGAILSLKYISSSQKLKIELPRHLMARDRVTEAPADPRNHVAKAQQAAREVG